MSNKIKSSEKSQLLHPEKKKIKSEDEDNYLKFKKIYDKRKSDFIFKKFYRKLGGLISKSMREDNKIDKVMKKMSANNFTNFVNNLKEKGDIKSTAYKDAINFTLEKEEQPKSKHITLENQLKKNNEYATKNENIHETSDKINQQLDNEPPGEDESAYASLNEISSPNIAGKNIYDQQSSNEPPVEDKNIYANIDSLYEESGDASQDEINLSDQPAKTDEEEIYATINKFNKKPHLSEGKGNFFEDMAIEEDPGPPPEIPEQNLSKEDDDWIKEQHLRNAQLKKPVAGKESVNKDKINQQPGDKPSVVDKNIYANIDSLYEESDYVSPDEINQQPGNEPPVEDKNIYANIDSLYEESDYVSPDEINQQPGDKPSVVDEPYYASPKPYYAYPKPYYASPKEIHLSDQPVKTDKEDQQNKKPNMKRSKPVDKHAKHVVVKRTKFVDEYAKPIDENAKPVAAKRTKRTRGS